MTLNNFKQLGELTQAMYDLNRVQRIVIFKGSVAEQTHGPASLSRHEKPLNATGRVTWL